jgi:hypothetical protein
MEYEVQAGLDEQSKAVVINTKIKITATEEELVNKEYLEKLLLEAAQASIKEYELLRPFADSMTLRKIGR